MRGTWATHLASSTVWEAPGDEEDVYGYGYDFPGRPSGSDPADEGRGGENAGGQNGDGSIEVLEEAKRPAGASLS